MSSLTANPMKRKRKRASSSALKSSSKQQTVTSYTLPDECWESIFRLIIINHNDDDNNNHHHLNSLSLVSKQFLSITNRLPFSFTVNKELNFSKIFKRFTDLTSLNIKSGYRFDLNKLLRKISRLPLKQLTSLNISGQPTFPANGLRAFSQKITTLTSLTCSNFNSLNPSHLFLIAECFPLLEQLELSYPSDCKNYSSYVDGVEALSLALIKLRKVHLSAFPINNQSIFHLFNNCKYLEEVIICWCNEITSVGLASALRDKLTLRSLSFSYMRDHQMFHTAQFIDSLVSLKGLTSVVLHYSTISDELLHSIAREGLPLTRFGLLCCNGHSYAGIISLLSKCRRIQHLDLQNTYFLNDQHVVQLSTFLVDLVSINLSCCWQLTDSTLFALVRNCPSLSEIKIVNIWSKSGENSDSLVDFGVYPQLKSLYLAKNSWLSDKIVTKYASIFPNLQLLDLNNCKRISEGIYQVLRKCCKLRYLNVSDCSRVKLLGMNFVVPNLEVLNLSNTKIYDETLYVISKNCCGLLQLLLRRCKGITEKAVKHVLENGTQLREVVWRDNYIRH